MNITRYNCESYFLDYYEKNLSPVEVAEVLFFLEENPDLKKLFKEYQPMHLEHIKVNFPNKESLKKMYSSKELNRILCSEISLANYEQFFVAKAEGILSEEKINSLSAFLSKHPNLEKEYDLIQQCMLPKEEYVFEGKNALKKNTITVANREEYFIRSAEKDLSVAEEKLLIAFLIQHPEYKAEAEIFEKTILSSELIPFEDKASLKKRERKPVFVVLFNQQNLYYAAAASIILLIGLFFFMQKEDSTPTLLANKSNVAVEKINNVQQSRDNEVVPNRKEQKTVEEPAKVKTIQKSISTSSGKVVPNPTSKAAAPEEQKQTPLISKSELLQEPILAQVEEYDPEETMKEEQEPENTLATVLETENSDSTTNTNAALEKESAVASVNTKSDANEYQTLASVVNKKIRSLLGIEKSVNCQPSDKIELWDLAMAGKRGIQKVIKTKNLDVEKVCEDNGKKVEYIFAARNFSISKSVTK